MNTRGALETRKYVSADRFRYLYIHAIVYFKYQTLYSLVVFL